MCPNQQLPTDLFAFIEEMPNEKLSFLFTIEPDLVLYVVWIRNHMFLSLTLSLFVVCTLSQLWSESSTINTKLYSSYFWHCVYVGVSGLCNKTIRCPKNSFLPTFRVYITPSKHQINYTSYWITSMEERWVIFIFHQQTKINLARCILHDNISRPGVYLSFVEENIEI